MFPRHPSGRVQAEEHLASADLIVVLTDHDALDWTRSSGTPREVLDTRNRVSSPLVDRL